MSVAILAVPAPTQDRAAPASPKTSVGAMIDRARQTQPDLMSYSPDRLLAYLFMAPQPCEALDRLLSGSDA